MQKNRKHSPSSTPTPTQEMSSNHYPVALPHVVSIDALAVLTDEELNKRFFFLEMDRYNVMSAGLVTRHWEEEIAYVQRELQIRRTRREAHDRYVHQLECEHSASEAYLPVADLDNSHFLRLFMEKWKN